MRQPCLIKTWQRYKTWHYHFLLGKNSDVRQFDNFDPTSFHQNTSSTHDSNHHKWFWHISNTWVKSENSKSHSFTWPQQTQLCHHMCHEKFEWCILTSIDCYEFLWFDWATNHRNDQDTTSQSYQICLTLKFLANEKCSATSDRAHSNIRGMV